jgi:hypothetical protein
MSWNARTMGGLGRSCASLGFASGGLRLHHWYTCHWLDAAYCLTFHSFTRSYVYSMPLTVRAKSLPIAMCGSSASSPSGTCVGFSPT